VIVALRRGGATDAWQIGESPRKPALARHLQPKLL